MPSGKVKKEKAQWEKFLTAVSGRNEWSPRPKAGNIAAALHPVQKYAVRLQENRPMPRLVCLIEN